MTLRTVSDIIWRGKTALARADLNAPLTARDGAVEVADYARLRAVVPTLQFIARRGGRAVILSHLGRPGGQPDAALSLRPVANALANELGQPVAFQEFPGVTPTHPTHPPTPPTPPHPTPPTHPSPPHPNSPGGAGEERRPASRPDSPGSPPDFPVFRLLENTRFHPGEDDNDAGFARQLAALGDVFVMDAFACAHRRAASVCAVADCFAPEQKCVGLLVEKELGALRRVLQDAKRPVVGVFGGAKISDKLPVIQHLAPRLDFVLVGGGAANTMLRAAGAGIGQSLFQVDAIPAARKILDGQNVMLPRDAVVAASPDAPARNVMTDSVGADDMILDIGPAAAAAFADIIRAAGTVIWNGPMGLFERDAFSHGTQTICAAVAASPGFSLAGGGETLAAVARFGGEDEISHLSTGGGALLEYLSGRRLPGLVAVGAQ